MSIGGLQVVRPGQQAATSAPWSLPGPVFLGLEGEAAMHGEMIHMCHLEKGPPAGSGRSTARRGRSRDAHHPPHFPQL